VNVHLVNPSSVSFGTAVITPRWQYVIVAATPRTCGDPMLVDETLFQMDPDRIQQGAPSGSVFIPQTLCVAMKLERWHESGVLM
jgi:hypothetical protein